MNAPLPALGQSSNSIRLLQICPGTGLEPVKGNLMVVDLDDDPIYEALSYTWGEENGKGKLIVEDVGISIQRNLADALYHLRLPSSIRVLWVDAVCINQDDKEEKARQIGMMRRIYSQCWQCVAWLGCGYPAEQPTIDQSIMEVVSAFDLLRFLASFHEHPDDSIHKKLPATLRTRDRQVGAVKAMEQIMASQNAWWHRIWTVQEIVLPILKVLVWRTQQISWETCLLAARVWHVEDNDVLKNILEPEILSVLDNVLNFSEPVISLSLTEKEAIERPFVTIQRYRYRNATDPRDKLYGLMGLLEPSSFPRVTYDYSLSAAEVFTNLTLDLVRLEGNLVPFCGMRGEKHATPNLPTWALDLVRPKDLINQGMIFWEQTDRYRVFSADNRQNRFVLNSSSSDAILALRGMLIDKLVCVDSGLAVDEKVLVPKADFIELIDRRRQVIEHSLADRRVLAYPTGRPVSEAFWRTMLGDVILRNERVERRAVVSDANLLQKFLESDEPNEADESIRSMAKNQDFFVTMRGYIGIGPSGLAVGDEAWVVYGSNVPLFLRAQEDEPGHVYIGDGFVHGVMDGDFARDTEHQWVDVTIH